MIDQSKKHQLVEHIKTLETSALAEILIPTHLFFDGYDDGRCNVCANNRRAISTSDFNARLETIAARPDVAAVFIRFFEYADALEFESCWIGSDSVYLVTSATNEEVAGWFVDFEVSDIWDEKDPSKFVNLPKIPDGFRLVAVWWD